MSTRTTAAIRALTRARPRPIRHPWSDRIRSGFARVQRRSLTWLGAYVAGLATAVSWAARDPGAYTYVVAAWLLLGVLAGSIAGWLRLDVYRRRMRHDQCGLVSVAGWRIAGDLSRIDPDLLLAIALLCYLFDHARLTSVAVRGHRRRMRTTYELGLRTLAREFGRESGASGRRAEALLAKLCDELHVIRRVPVGTAVAFRLVDESVGSALARVEQAAGSGTLFAWSLGRDPAWDLRDKRSSSSRSG